MPPRSWVDKDTGHRVWRLSDEPNSGAFYFNINAYTPDNKQMIYSAPDGIHVLDLATRQTKLLVPNPPGTADRNHARPRHHPYPRRRPQDQQRLLHHHRRQPRHRSLQSGHQHRRHPQTGCGAASAQHLRLVGRQRQCGRNAHRRNLRRRRRHGQAIWLQPARATCRRSARSGRKSGQPRRKRRPGPALSTPQQERR